MKIITHKTILFFLVFSLSFWFMMLPSPVLASDSDNYFMDFDTGYVNGDQMSETWGYSWHVGDGEAEVNSNYPYSGLYSYRIKAGGSYGIFQLNNTDFESFSFWFTLTATTSGAGFNIDFLHNGSTKICNIHLELYKESDWTATVYAWDGSSNQRVCTYSDEVEDWMRLCVTKLSDTSWNLSVYDFDNNYYDGRDNAVNMNWSDWNGVVQFNPTNDCYTYIDDLSYNGGVGAVGTADGNTTINCYNESSGAAITNWSLQVYDEYGGIYYSANNLTNPLTINHSVYGTGKTFFEFGKSGYKNRTYYADIENGIHYDLDAFLPLDTGKLYYIRVINNFTEPIYNVNIVVNKFVDGVFKEISNGFTDVYGLYALYLSAGETYLVNLSKEGYSTKNMQTLIPDPNYYGSDYPIIYKLDWYTAETPDFTFWDHITYDGWMNNDGSITIEYADTLENTEDTYITVYEKYNDTETPLHNDSRSNDDSFSFNVADINTTRLHYADLYFNHTLNISIDQPVRIFIYPINYSSDVSPPDLETQFTDAFGDNPLGWGNSIAVFIGLIFLASFAPFNAGLAIISGGLSIIVVEIVFVVNNTLLLSIIPVIILIGIVYILAKQGGLKL